MKTALLLIASSMLALAAKADERKPVNVKSMLSASCYAGSRADKAALGGYGISNNAPKPIIADHGKSGSITLVALPESTIPIAKSYRGLRLLLINATASEAAFTASDSRLPIVQEAIDSKGQWRAIEYLPPSWCGNSFHRVFLPAQHYWEFAVPVYKGKQRTRLRFTLQTMPPIHSNEIEGSINPAQFTRKPGQKPANLMDPYSE